MADSPSLLLLVTFNSSRFRPHSTFLLLLAILDFTYHQLSLYPLYSFSALHYLLALHPSSSLSHLLLCFIVCFNTLWFVFNCSRLPHQATLTLVKCTTLYHLLCTTQEAICFLFALHSAPNTCTTPLFVATSSHCKMERLLYVLVSFPCANSTWMRSATHLNFTEYYSTCI